ncbi:hypothetical protein B0H13DRAFT_2317953 [Mycena leptocephala]|nr:hypothetical protein B0H13DRAFT_2317953 [Mycena leptocephala]
MEYVVDPVLFAPSWAIMVDIVCLTCTTLLLYGLYILLFIASIRTLAQRNVPRRRLLVGTTIAMFLLGTCGTFVVVAMAGVSIRITKAVVEGSTDLPRLIGVLGVLQLTEVVRVSTNNVVTDLLFLYRCYLIWGSKKKVLIVPAFCILATVVLMVISWLTPPDQVEWYNFVDALADRFSRPNMYNTAIVLILESGAIYCLCLILWVISLTTLTPTGEFAAIFSGITGGLVAQIVNIAPTLILVRVGMGRQWNQDTVVIGDRLPSDGNDDIKFRTPVEPADGPYPVVEIK